MPTVAFTVPAAPSTTQILGRKQVTILETDHGVDGPITLPITSPEVDITVGSTDWQTVPRAGRRDLLLARGQKLSTMKLTVQVVGATADDPVGCEAVLGTLSFMASLHATALIVNYGTFESSGYILNQGTWRMTGYTIKSKKRQSGTNGIVWAEAELTFTEASDIPLPAVLPSQTVAPTAPVAPAGQASHGGAPAPSRVYTVRSGDTLWGISVQFYGTGAKWTTIASVNGITDPRTIHPGQVLKIP